MLLHETDHYQFTLDETAGILKFLWHESTADMQAGDFKAALQRYAGYAESHRAARLMVDIRDFKFAMTAELGAWRDEAVAPIYNRAGVRKFAYVVPDGFPKPDGEQTSDFEDYVTQYFDSEEQAVAWLTAA